ncbi:TorF family putative porin [Hephaestia sp. GCM10023244]|uniref:TorF family putative porin n=1 Tax=unclassified Hephaestia TaxID=2631281 RepID=UPI002077160C|nr:TorF family putative porin [Hephaestia sp. MAHUQ-44]MCM8729399.1 TorF family putative porin [Hephaestia sp. MAHUQ-44]
MRFTTLHAGALVLPVIALLAALPAAAQDTAPPPPVRITGNVTLVSDYRFRGLTESGEDGAAQATLNLNSASGFYVGTFVSTIDGKVSLPGYGGGEIDLYGGYAKTMSNGIGVDVGLLYYYYPDHARGLNTDYFEPYASISYTIGPVSAELGGTYAWGGQKGLDFTTGNDDNLYLYGEASLGIPSTPITLKGHVGHTKGALGLYNPLPGDDKYWDWSVSATATGGPLTVGVSYLDTDISNAGGFAQRHGRGATVLGSVGVAF